MRTIKFRSWSTSWKCMRNSEDDWWIGIEINSGKKVCVVNGKIEDAPEEIIVMQFTGLHDKNGKEIYEGDIVENNNEVWDIYYSDDGAWKMGLNGNRTNNDHLFLLEPLHSEVIGNIYENPNLLTP